MPGRVAVSTRAVTGLSKKMGGEIFLTCVYVFFLLSDILRMDSTNADALYVRGLCLYYEDCIDKAVQFFVQALRMAPDHDKARLACRVSHSLLNRTQSVMCMNQTCEE